jgi:hypothetical protein
MSDKTEFLFFGKFFSCDGSVSVCDDVASALSIVFAFFIFFKAVFLRGDFFGFDSKIVA